MCNRIIVAACAAACFILSTAQVFAHATLEQQEAHANSSYKGVMRIGHGCEGSATTQIRILIPDGVIAVKPQPKPGWQVQTVIGPLAQPVDYYGETLTEGVREVIWNEGHLLDEHYDEFVFRAKLPDQADTTIYFPTYQTCKEGERNWIEIPEAGKDPHDYKSPAPGLNLTKGQHHHH